MKLKTKLKPKKMTKCVRRCWKSFCVIFFCKDNLGRDLLVLGLLGGLLGTFIFYNQHLREKARKADVARIALQNQDAWISEEDSVKKEEREVAEVQSRIDTGSWTSYQNTWYGFSLKYPDDWLDPAVRKPGAGEMWEQKIDFRMEENGEDNPFEGFDVKVYDIEKVKELANTDEFPKLKNAELAQESGCAVIEGHLLETGDYPAEEIYVPASDPCYNAALFFANTRDDYMYTIVPKLKDGAGMAGDPSREIGGHIPEFFAVAKNWNLIDIRRPKSAPPKPAKPRINAPMPVSYKKVDGRLVCEKSNDHPGKSKKGKGKHLDMECCLDPDEYPNPNCYYSPGKYGKYL